MEGGEEYQHKSKEPPYLYTKHIVTTSSTELYSLMKIFLTVFKIEGIVALTIKERLLRKYKVRVFIQMSCHSREDFSESIK